MKAWQLIEKGWNQNQVALDKNGDNINVPSDEAVSWCALGAIWHLYSDNRGDMEILVDNVVTKRYPQYNGYLFPTLAFNEEEGRTQAEVLEVFKEADV